MVFEDIFLLFSSLISDRNHDNRIENTKKVVRCIALLNEALMEGKLDTVGGGRRDEAR